MTHNTSPKAAEQLQLAHTRQAIALLLLGCAALTWVPGHHGESLYPVSLISGRPLALLVRYAVLAAAFGAFQGARRIHSRLPNNQVETQEDLIPANEAQDKETQSEIQDKDTSIPPDPASATLPAKAAPNVPVPPTRVQVIAPTLTKLSPQAAPQLLPAWTAFLPERWETQALAGGVVVKRDDLPPLRVLEGPATITPAELTQVLWVPEEGVENTNVLVQSTPYGWQVRGSALQLVQTLEAL